ncbi:hypothetical protein PMAYCL1PPCAC_06625, partial [Pristionchus mayeri]
SLLPLFFPFNPSFHLCLRTWAQSKRVVEMRIDSLDALPPELLQSIFGHLPAHFCLSTVARVCPLFYRLVHDENWWNGRKKAVGVVLDEREERRDNFSLQRVICSGEREEDRWRKLSTQTMYSISGGHYGAINTCKLYTEMSGGKRCVSAGRDRTIRLWDLDRVVTEAVLTEEEEEEGETSNVRVVSGREKKEILHSVDDAHGGWIWIVTRPNSSNVTYSCGWDNMVKRWQITPSGMKESGGISLSSAVLGLDWIDGSENELISTTFLRRVSLLDVREKMMECKDEHSEHRNAVIGVTSKGKYVYSWGEDRLVVLSDIRNLSSPVAKVTIPRAYASQLSIGPTSVVAGTMKGECFYLDPINLETWGSFDVQEVCEGTASKISANPLRGIINTGHSLVTLSKLGKLNALSYGLKPRSLIDSLKLDGEPSKVDYMNDDVIVSMGDGRLVYWSKP